MRRSTGDLTRDSDVPLASLEDWQRAIGTRQENNRPASIVGSVSTNYLDRTEARRASSPFECGQEIRSERAARTPEVANLIDMGEPLSSVPCQMGNMEFLKEFTSSMSQLLSRFTEISQQPTPERPTLSSNYSGKIEEDPEQYLNAVDSFIERSRVRAEGDKINVARKGLQAEARQWAEQIKNMPMSYGAFCDRFLDEFNSPRRKVLAYSDFYARHQAEKESSEVFISIKQALLSRLRTNMEPETTVEMVISLLRPAIASRIAGVRPATLEELIRVVRRIEPEVAREYKTMRSDAARTTSNRPTVPQLACRWCGGPHYDRSCDQNPYNRPAERHPNAMQHPENYQRAGGDQDLQQHRPTGPPRMRRETSEERRERAYRGRIHPSQYARGNRGGDVSNNPRRDEGPSREMR